jgi:hypothetical protein
MFWKEPIIWIFLDEKKRLGWLLLLDAAYKKTYVSARTIRVRLVFSIVNLVFPAWPAIRPKKRGIKWIAKFFWVVYIPIALER